MSIAAAESPFSRIGPGAGEPGVFYAGLPLLAGEAGEGLFGAVRPAGRMGPVALFQAEGWLLGAATVPLALGLEDAARRLYRNIFKAAREWHLARIWNYVPAINEPGHESLENYRVFCRGRSLAFEKFYGDGFRARLPSSSAVGTKSAALTVAFAACRVRPRHVENPLQIPAYDYPGEYGPRAPCFARATVVPEADRATVFISGTAAIRGHLTVFPNATRKQLDCTLENLRGISVACGLGPGLDRGGNSMRHFKVYLRRAADQPLVAATLEKRFLSKMDRVSYFRADLCRTELRVEIEASLVGVTALRV
jgi:chorismate lyase/3-hydroxybenzoate synthase